MRLILNKRILGISRKAVLSSMNLFLQGREITGTNLKKQNLANNVGFEFYKPWCRPCMHKNQNVTQSNNEIKNVDSLRFRVGYMSGPPKTKISTQAGLWKEWNCPKKSTI